MQPHATSTGAAGRGVAFEARIFGVQGLQVHTWDVYIGNIVLHGHRGPLRCRCHLMKFMVRLLPALPGKLHLQSSCS